MAAVADDAINRGAVTAHLGPARPAMVAIPATRIVKHQNPVADLELLGVDARPNGGDDATGFVTGDKSGVGVDPARRQILPAKRFDHLRGLVAVKVKVAATDARGLHLYDHFARTRGGILEFQDLKLTTPTENDALHGFLPQIDHAPCGP